MKKLAIRIPYLVLAIGATLSFGWRIHAESNRFTFPENLDQLAHYITVKRVDVIEHIGPHPMLSRP